MTNKRMVERGGCCKVGGLMVYELNVLYRGDDETPSTSGHWDGEEPIVKRPEGVGF